MSLAIDFVGTNIGSGTKTYNIYFCKVLQKTKIDENIYIFLSKNYYNEIKFLKKNPKIKFIIKSNIFSNIFIRLFWMQFCLPFSLKMRGINKLFSPMNICPIFNLFNIKIILGLHSNLPWIYFKFMPGNFIKKYITKKIMEFSIYRSNLIIIPSIFAKKEIQKKLKLKKKIKVINHGVKIDYRENLHKKEKFQFKNTKYFLSILSCVKYHNILNLLKAYKSLIKKKKINLKFIIVMQVLDKKYFNQISDFVLKNFKKKDLILINDLSFLNIIKLYDHSKFYIFSSYCEVFGFTTLEAMSRNIPVLTSNKSALPEINGNAAIYFDPDNLKDIEYKIYKINNSKILRKKLIRRGKKHVRKFSWEQCVTKTLSCINSL
tara:strand:+ start:449 stop:1573 length:1125 start_codon:yes stop_codon:yes gene_type:complete